MMHVTIMSVLIVTRKPLPSMTSLELARQLESGELLGSWRLEKDEEVDEKKAKRLMLAYGMQTDGR